MAKGTKFNTNKEAVNLLNNVKGSIENKIRTAYNLGYKDGYKSGTNNTISDMIGMMSDKWDTDRKTEPTGYNLLPVEDEPQTDGILFKGNLKEGDYKLIKTSNGWVLEGNDIAYCGEPQTDCPWK